MLSKPYLTPIKTLTVTLPDRVIHTLDTPDTPTTTESKRYSWDVTAESIPTYSCPVESVVHMGRVAVSGYNNSGGNITVYFATYYNGTLHGSGSLLVATTKYFTADCCFLGSLLSGVTYSGVKVGDTLEVAVWVSSNTGVTILEYMTFVVHTRIIPTTNPVFDVTETYIGYPAASPTGSAPTNGRLYNGYGDYGVVSSGTYTCSARNFQPLGATNPPYGMHRYGHGDYQNADTGAVRVTTSPYVRIYGNSAYLSSVSYRELKE